MTSIQEVTLGESVTSISNDAFNGTGWYEAQPDGLLYLDNWLLGYKGDKPTGDLAIADGTRGIAQSAFRDCTGLTSVTSFIKEPFTIDNYIFSVYTTATLYVPAGTKGKYEATPGWNKFRSILEIEMPDQPKGDVNGDQTVDVADIASVIDCMAGSEAVDKAAADVNGDGTVDVADIATIISEMAAQARQQDIED